MLSNLTPSRSFLSSAILSVSFFLDTFACGCMEPHAFLFVSEKRDYVFSNLYCKNEESSQKHMSLSPLFQGELLFMSYWLGLSCIFIYKLINDKRHQIGMIAIGQGF